MRELKNVIRRGRTAGLTPAHYAISDVPAGIFDADVFAHFSLALSLSIRFDSMGWRMCSSSCCCCYCCGCQRGRVDRGYADWKKGNKKNLKSVRTSTARVLVAEIGMMRDL